MRDKVREAQGRAQELQNDAKRVAPEPYMPVRLAASIGWFRVLQGFVAAGLSCTIAFCFGLHHCRTGALRPQCALAALARKGSLRFFPLF